jgi:hypothetical protein
MEWRIPDRSVRMAQRTGNKRLLESLGKLASAGWIPALAAAGLFAISDCGGSSDAQTASTSPPAKNTTTSNSSNSTTSASSSSPKSSPAARSSDEGGKDVAKKVRDGKHGLAWLPEGTPERASTPAQEVHATVASMSLESPTLAAAPGSLAMLSATYTCDGADDWPALSWRGVPAGTAELILFAMNVQSVEEKLFFDWAVAGLDPGHESIEAGRLPKGAIVGFNGSGRSGYSIRPTGSSETYMFTLYALPEWLAPARGFDPRALRREVLGVSGNVGLLPAFYARS